MLDDADTPGAYTHNTPMPWGKHEGILMANLPAAYLLDLYTRKLIAGPLLKYVTDNLHTLQNQK